MGQLKKIGFQFTLQYIYIHVTREKHAPINEIACLNGQRRVLRIIESF